MVLVGYQAAVSNGGLTSEALPTRIKVLSWGRNDTLKGPVIVDETTAHVFNENQKKIGRDRAPIDFDHNTVRGTPAHKDLNGNPPVIFGYGTPTVIPGDGIWFENIQWTPDGEKNARNFIDLSPTPLMDEANRVLAIHSCALTPAGAVDGLHFYSAFDSFQHFMKTLSTADSPSTPDAYRETRKLVDDQGLSKTGPMNKEHFDYFRAMCHLSADASENDIRDHVVKTMTKAFGADADGETTMKHLSAVMGWVKSDPSMGTSPPHMNNFPSEGGPVYQKLVAEVQKPLLEKIATLNAGIEAIQSKQKEQVFTAEQAEKNSHVQRVTDSGRVFPVGEETLKTLSVSAVKEMADNIMKQALSVPTSRKGTTLRQVELGADGKPVRKTLSSAAAAIDAQIGSTRTMAI